MRHGVQLSGNSQWLPHSQSVTRGPLYHTLRRALNTAAGRQKAQPPTQGTAAAGQQGSRTRCRDLVWGLGTKQLALLRPPAAAIFVITKLGIGDGRAISSGVRLEHEHHL